MIETGAIPDGANIGGVFHFHRSEGNVLKVFSKLDGIGGGRR
jgi:hypothetical protein